MNGRPRYTKEELSNIVKDFYIKNGRVPKKADFSNVKGTDLPSVKQFIDEWGSFNHMLLDLGLITDTKRAVNKNIHICQQCGKKFNAYGKRKYCSTECKSLGARKYEGDTKSTNVQSYRRIAFKNYDWKCHICGFEEDLEYTKGTKDLKFPVILDVHHLDEDRTNNDVNNLIIICPTCHAKIHRGIIRVERVKPFKKVRVIYNEVFGGKQIPPNVIRESL